METHRTLLAVTAVVFVVAPVASGPLVGVDLAAAAQGETAPPGTGSAEVRVLSVPTDAITLDRGEFGAGTYHVAAPPARVEVTAVERNPVLRYSIDVPALGIVETSRYELNGADGRLSVAFAPFEISPKQIDDRQYDATVAIGLHTDGNVQDVRYQADVTIRVEAHP